MSINGQIPRRARIVPEMDGLPRPVFARNETLSADSQTKWHQHDWIQLSFALKGIITVYTEQGCYIAPPLWAIWIPAGLQHQVITTDHVEMRGLYLESSLAKQSDDKCRVIEVSPLLRELISTFSHMPILYDEAGREGRLVNVLIDELLASPTAQFSLPMPTDIRLQRLCSLLQQEPDNQSSLRSFGEQIGASEKTLSRLFLKETGLTFRIWRQRLRLITAMRHLENKEKVTSVALSSGYQSTSAFIHAFRELFGITPGELFK